jgi:hypothetical protein
MRTGDAYGRQAIPVLANMLADALMVGTGETTGTRVGGSPSPRDAPRRAGLVVRGRRVLRSALAAVDGWLHRQTMRRWEAYLAQSRSIYELEARLRKLERGDGPLG